MLAAASCLLLLASACSSAPEPTDAGAADGPSVLVRAVEALDGVEHAEVAVRFSAPFSLSAAGDLNLQSMDFEVEARGVELGLQGVTVRSVDGETWAAAPDLYEGFVPAASLPAAGQEVIEQIVAAMDLSRFLGSFTQAVGDWQDMGPRTVEGDVLTVHRAAVDTSEVEGLPALDALADGEGTLEVWVREDGVPMETKFRYASLDMAFGITQLGQGFSVQRPVGAELGTY